MENSPKHHVGAKSCCGLLRGLVCKAENEFQARTESLIDGVEVKMTRHSKQLLKWGFGLFKSHFAPFARILQNVEEHNFQMA